MEEELFVKCYGEDGSDLNSLGRCTFALVGRSPSSNSDYTESSLHFAFPNLRGVVDPAKFDDSYLRFKVEYILGECWRYRTTKHIWRGDSFTQVALRRSLLQHGEWKHVVNW